MCQSRGSGTTKFFFFSSRRRHTRLQGDWSSDVCSSDLVLPAEDVQVRIYSAHPPTALTVLAIEGHLHWRSCPACPEETGQSLTVESAKASTPARTKDPQKEFLITGIYRLQPPDGPTFSSSFPLRIQAPVGGLV